MKERETVISPCVDQYGRRRVHWLVNGVWVWKGWLMPEVKR